MSEIDNSAERLSRIAEMEERLNRLNQALERVEEIVDVYADMWNDYQALASYYSSSTWWEDLDADERGLLPASLSRGVLSEDGIYNALGQADSLREQLIEVANNPQNMRRD